MTTTAIPFHPLADLFPLMEGSEFDALVADIKKNGCHYPIVLFEGKILDGRNRYRACLAAGFDPAVRNGDSWIGDPSGFVISRNIYRRHLTAAQKRDLIGRLLRADPGKSNNAIAKESRIATDKTVAAVRAELEATSEIPKLEKTVGADGKARKPPKPAVPPANHYIRKLLTFHVDYSNEYRAWLPRAELSAADREALIERLQSCAQDLVLMAQETEQDDGLDIPECLRRDAR